MPELLRGKGASSGSVRYTLPDRAAHHAARARRAGARAPGRDVGRRRRRGAADVRRGAGRGAPGRARARRGPRRALPRRPVHAQPDRVPAVVLRRPVGGRRRRAAERRLARAAAPARDRARRRAGDHRPRRPAGGVAGARRSRCGRADRRHVAGGRAARDGARRARGRVPLVDLRPLVGAGARAARQLRDRADPVHLGHHRQLEGGFVSPPLPVPVLGGGLGRAGAHERRRAHDGRCRCFTSRRCTSSATRRCTPAVSRTSRAASRRAPTGRRSPRTARRSGSSSGRSRRSCCAPAARPLRIG